MQAVTKEMKIAVITPYYKETDSILAQCLVSVAAQTASCDHIIISDGFPNPLVDRFDVRHILLPIAHADNGNTPRVLGGVSAFNLGYDAIAFLDADNWFDETHIERMIALHRRTNATVCTAGRSMHREDGSFMFDDDKNDGKSHVDTSCFFLTKPCHSVLARWSMMPRELGPICDTIYFGSIRRAGLPCAHDTTASVRFRTTYEADFRRMNEAMPENVKLLETTMESVLWFRSLPVADRRRIKRDLGWPQGGSEPLWRRLKALRGRVLAAMGQRTSAAKA